MREIKFRAKAKDSKQWVYGFYYEQPAPIHCFGKQDEPTGYIITRKPYTLTDWDMPIPMVAIEVDRNTLGQSTGLKNKNGKEIYEGDILERKFTGLGYELGNRTFVSWDKYRYVQNWIMKFKKNLKDNKDLGTWIKSITPQKLDLDAHLEDFEVIGNIYENPELLEVEG